MATLSNNIFCEFCVNSVQVSSRVDAFLNSIKRRETVFYSEKTKEESPILGLVSSANKNRNYISVTNLDNPLLNNKEDDTVTSSGLYIYRKLPTGASTTDWQTTNKVPVVNGVPVPLFNFHQLSNHVITRLKSAVSSYEVSAAITNDITIKEVKILNKNMEEVTSAVLEVDTTYGLVWNNLTNSFKSKDNCDFYYVQYTVVDATGENTYLDLLYNQPSQIGYKTLLVMGGYIYRYTRPDGTTGYWATRTRQDKKIEVLPQSEYDKYSRWLFSLTRAAKCVYFPKYLITRDLEGTIVSGVWNHDSIYHTLNTVVSAPDGTYGTERYQKENRKAIIVNDSVISVPFDNITEWGENDTSISLARRCRSIALTIKDSSGKVLYNLRNKTDVSPTSEPDSLIGPGEIPYVSWNKTNRLGIKNIDKRTGLIYIEGIKLDPSYIATYSLKRDLGGVYDVEYGQTTWDFIGNNDEEDFDLNPFREYSVVQESYKNRYEICNNTYVLHYSYEGEFYTTTINEDGLVINGTRSPFDYKVPGTSNLYYDYSGPTEGPFEIYYPTKPSYLKQTWPTEWLSFKEFEDRLAGDPIVALIKVQEPTKINDYNAQNLYVSGGGIRENHYRSVSKMFSCTKWFWDKCNWDGVLEKSFYDTKCSYLVEIPTTLLEGSEGNFTHKQVKDIVNRHTAFGTYPIVRGYGIDFTISGIKSVEGNLIIDWDGHGESDMYWNVYTSANSSGPWDLENESPMVDSGVNTITISGLTENSTYYVQFIGGHIIDSEFVPLLNQIITPNNSGTVDIGNTTLQPIKVIHRSPKATLSDILTQEFTVS